jgi:hypothetical protein
LAEYTDNAADFERARGQAESAIIRAQAVAALDRAQAYTMTINSTLPWLIVGVVGLFSAFGLAVVALIFFVTVNRATAAPPQILTERHYYFPGQPNRVQLSAGSVAEPVEVEQQKTGRMIYL